jgi:hypothetical protein
MISSWDRQIETSTTSTGRKVAEDRSCTLRVLSVVDVGIHEGLPRSFRSEFSETNYNIDSKKKDT